MVLAVNLIPVNAMAHICFFLSSTQHGIDFFAAYNHFLQDTEETYFVITGNENIWISIGFGETHLFFCVCLQRNTGILIEHLIVDIFCDQGLIQHCWTFVLPHFLNDGISCSDICWNLQILERNDNFSAHLAHIEPWLCWPVLKVTVFAVHQAVGHIVLIFCWHIKENKCFSCSINSTKWLNEKLA